MPRFFLPYALFCGALGEMEQAHADVLQNMRCCSEARHLPQLISGLTGWI